jgi:DNA-binding transcriptional ArsR family regulator
MRNKAIKNSMRMTTPLTLVGKALSHPVREQMLRVLEDGERCGCEFAPEFGIDPSMVSRYLAMLERAGLVVSRRDGVRVMWSLADPRILEVLERLAELTGERVVNG